VTNAVERDGDETPMNLAAAAWIMLLPCLRGGLTPAAKLVLLALWSHAKWTVFAPQRVKPSRETIARETGLTSAVVRDALAKLAELRWVTRDGSKWLLAWEKPTAQAVDPADAAVQVVDTAGGSSRRAHSGPDGSTNTLDGSSERFDGLSRRPSEPSSSKIEQSGESDAHKREPQQRTSPHDLDLQAGRETAANGAESGADEARRGNAVADARALMVDIQRDRAAERKADAAENKRRSAAEMDRVRLAKQTASADFDARVQPSGTAQRESKLDGAAAAITALPPGFWQVVVSHPATLVMAMNPREAWVKALGEVIVGRRLTVEQFTALLDRLESQRDDLGTAAYNAAVRAGTFPSIEDLWFKWGKRSAMCRAWLDENIEIVQLLPGQRPFVVAMDTTGMSHAAVVGSTEKWQIRRAQLDAEAALRPPEPLDDDDIEWGPHATGVIQ
jgi:hypothetical protein